ncbi:MAG TPA: endonuclease V [Methanomassiliicoccales archaeon]
MAEITSGPSVSVAFDLEDHDMAQLVYQATTQIPRGMVSTYGAIARALGDIRAARAVGMILSGNPTPIVVPCHRIVYNDGKVGWYAGKGCGRERKESLLREEGIDINEGQVVDLKDRLFLDFDIEPLLTKMRLRQEELSPKVVREDDFAEPNAFAGLDVAYRGNDGYAVKVIQDASTGEIVGSGLEKAKVLFPYVPTYLTYRELPILSRLIDRTMQGMIHFIDGQGMLHPRRFGIACHLGVCMDVPTVGVAKSLLVGKVEENGSEESPILLEGEVLGIRLTLPHRHPLYISVGHRVSLETAVDLVRKATKDRARDPLGIADRLSKEQRRTSMAMEG